ncbi:TonB-dependent receptor [Sphingosinicella terrae]|uniref:TonB-dependent receptor n=1 Tax=Sphingosinicella terrae TaxID=2172047 RepID=UPI0013B3CEFB|nr:TonB-dependent receptor [Sphingosinicella terrae]
MMSAAPALAQDAGTPSTAPSGVDDAAAAEADADAQGAERSSTTDNSNDIVVTAQRREQLLQDVPIAISALDAETLDARNIADIENLDSYVPNLRVYTGTFAASGIVAIRGGVEISNTPYYDPAVGTYVDGVYIAKAAGNFFRLADIERIEVLRGPQGTLYGRNTFAGAVNIITQRPSGEFGGNVRLGIGNYDQVRGRVNLDLPAIGDFSIKLAGLHDSRDGYVRVVPNPFPTPLAQPGAPSQFERSENTAFRAAIRYQPTTDITVDYALDYNLINATPRAPILVDFARAPLAGALFDPASPSYLGFPAYLYLQDGYSDFTYANGGIFNEPNIERSEVLGHTLIAEFDVGPATLKSISSIRTMDYRNNVDLDGTPLAIATTDLANDYGQESQEFQITGEAGSLNYTAGLYYFHEAGDVRKRGQFFGSARTAIQYYRFETDAYAAYAQVDLRVTDRLTLTGGLRYSYEQKSMRVRQDTLTAAGTTVDYGLREDERSDEAFTPALILQYEPDANVNLYLKYARGFKSGGFNLGSTAAFAITTFDPQTVDSFEGGAKLRFMNGAFQINTAVFFNQIHDQQVNVFRNEGILAAVVVDNAAQGEQLGAEVDFQLRPNDWLRLSGSVGYLDSRYKEYFDRGVDVSDTRAVIFAPEWTLAATAEARLIQRDWGSVFFNVDFSHTSAHFVQAYDVRPRSATIRASAQTTKAEATSLVDVGLRATDIPAFGGTAEINLWVRNLFDTHRRQGGIDFDAALGNLTVAYYNPPRTFGADLTFRF